MKTFCYHCGYVFDVLQSDSGADIVCPACKKRFCVELYDENKLIENITPKEKIELPNLIQIAFRGGEILCGLNTFAFIIFSACFLISLFVYLISGEVKSLTVLIYFLAAFVYLSIAWGLFMVLEVTKQLKTRYSPDLLKTEE